MNNKSIGWSFPVGANANTGKIQTTQLKDDIRQSIIILLSTIPGERLFHKDYGCNLNRFMFEPITYELIKAIREEVLSSVMRWERRIYNADVSILNDAEEEGRIVISVSYIIPTIKEFDTINYIYNLQ